MNDIDLARYPLDRPDSPDWQRLVNDAKTSLDRDGLFNLPGFVTPEALDQTLSYVRPRLASESFHHSRWHNVYFKDAVDGVAPDHPALQKVETANHTLCHDQLAETPLDRIYRYDGFIRFLEAVMDQPQLHIMDDPLAGVNVLEYREGEALNWHFDRSIFTTTVLLQEAHSGGVFEYARNLRSADDPNHAGIADLLDGRLRPTALDQAAGTLNVFLGVNTAHRVSRVRGPQSRIVAVLSHYDRPGMAFTDAERMGFFGRTG
ncbi:2OG-Fe(II) oxygenase [uncultured Tateyamaria sp.]|uniref:2OG-Fe(II) oxygenase n=1 Tax=Tateyamaria sp. 1078 TaxID=3417464 RepID=UPI002632F268|nr:2OG-Fe(II) oxygenase [uncultured Tateyamaria sp.]